MISEKKDLENEYKSMLEKNQQEMEEMQKSFNQRLEEAKAQVSFKTTPPTGLDKQNFQHKIVNIFFPIIFSICLG